MEEIRALKVAAVGPRDGTAGFPRLAALMADRQTRRRACRVRELHPGPDFFLEISKALSNR
jgi:hypothetical protein